MQMFKLVIRNHDWLKLEMVSHLKSWFIMKQYGVAIYHFITGVSSVMLGQGAGGASEGRPN